MQPTRAQIRRAARPDHAAAVGARLPEPAFQRASPAGRSTQRERAPCLRLSSRSPSASLALCFRAGVSPRSARHLRPNLGQPITPGDLAPWDISVMPDGTGLPRRQRHRRARRADLPGRNAPPATARTARAAKPPLVGGPPRTTLDGGKTIANFWPYATTIFDFIRRAMPGSAAIAQRPGGLRADRVSPLAQQADRRARRDQRADPAEGQHAEPRRFHPALSRENVAASVSRV